MQFQYMLAWATIYHLSLLSIHFRKIKSNPKKLLAVVQCMNSQTCTFCDSELQRRKTMKCSEN